jgi:alcohol dehydrogenase class IV
MTFQLAWPGEIIFGTGTFGRIGESAAELGSRPLVVAGKGALRCGGWIEKALGLIRKAGGEPTCFEGVEHDPAIETVERGIAATREAGCDAVVAIGGGSALDAGKLIAGLAAQTFSVQEFFDGTRDLERPTLPFLAAPTTAGTGSECTKVAVLTDPKQGIKKGLRHDRMMPRIALVDPELTLSAPPEVTAHSGMDALTQAIESYVGRGANPATDALAERAVSLLATNLEAAVREGDRIEHREPVALGSLLGAMAFGNAGLGAVHGLAHPVGVLCGLPHGLVCAVLLPAVCEFNLSARRDKFDTLARLIGVKSAEAVPGALRKLNGRVGIPATFHDFGLNESQFLRILADCRSGSMANNPREASDENLVEILRNLL